MLDEATHIDKRVLPLADVRQPRYDLFYERHQTLTRLRRLSLGDRSFHPAPSRTMTAYADAVRGPEAGPFRELTKHY